MKYQLEVELEGGATLTVEINAPEGAWLSADDLAYIAKLAAAVEKVESP